MEQALVIAALVALLVVARVFRRKPPARRTPSTRHRAFVPPRILPYPGDFKGRVKVAYHPHLDGRADPGEVVWTWVPYEDDYSKGKDRPVLIIGEDGPWLLALQLTSKDHAKAGTERTDNGRRWLDIGPGAWDRQGRRSEVRLDRVVRVDPLAVRREGAILDKVLFDRITGSL